MLNLILAYDDAGLSSTDVAEARNDATPALGARLKEAHRRAAAALVGELAGLSSSEAYDRAWGWALEKEHRLIAWGLREKFPHSVPFCRGKHFAAKSSFLEIPKTIATISRSS